MILLKISIKAHDSKSITIPETVLMKNRAISLQCQSGTLFANLIKI